MATVPATWRPFRLTTPPSKPSSLAPCESTGRTGGISGFARSQKGRLLGGAKDGVIHYPLSWNVLLAIDSYQQKKTEGSIYASLPTLGGRPWPCRFGFAEEKVVWCPKDMIGESQVWKTKATADAFGRHPEDHFSRTPSGAASASTGKAIGPDSG